MILISLNQYKLIKVFLKTESKRCAMIFDRNVKELALDFSIDQKAYVASTNSSIQF